MIGTKIGTTMFQFQKKGNTMKHADRAFTLAEFLMVVAAITALLGSAQRVGADETSTAANAPGYFGAVKAYADAMLSKGRDTYGQEHSPLFAAALDRKTMVLGSAKQFGKISGVREKDRSIGGANPQEDKTLCLILYRLSELTGEKQYAAEADKALKYFWTHCQSPETGLMAWGEHLYWDFESDKVAGRDEAHEINGSWPLWDRSYALAPDACWRFAIGLWDHQVADKSTGDFSRHARWSKHGTYKGADFPRYAGQMITCWADAYSRRENTGRERRDEMATAIRTLVGRMETNMKRSESGYLPAIQGKSYAWSGSNLELARCLWVSAPSMDGELAERMRALALRQDTDFHRLPHRITEGGGFASTLDTRTGKPRHRSMNKPYTAVWATGYGHGTHAGMALKCVSRYHQLRETHGELAGKYRALIVAAADRYLDTLPDVDKLVKPGALAEVNDLLVATHELTGDAKYLQRADRFGRLSLELFIDDTSPLPKATNRHDHYEAITGGIELMRSLLRLHEALAG